MKYQFDLLVLFFPHDITSNMGGTLIVPSSHYRKVNGNSIKRYQHVVGEKQITCKAGTIMFLHHNLWHSGRSNNSNNERILFKLIKAVIMHHHCFIGIFLLIEKE